MQVLHGGKEYTYRTMEYFFMTRQAGRPCQWFSDVVGISIYRLSERAAQKSLLYYKSMYFMWWKCKYVENECKSRTLFSYAQQVAKRMWRL